MRNIAILEKYNFNWLVDDIDTSIIFMLHSGNEALASYQVSEILTDGVDNASIKFANVNDLNNFVNLAMIRFVDWQDKSNFVDIPVRNLKVLYDSALSIGSEIKQGVDLNKLEAFSIYDGSVTTNGYALYAYKVNDITPELSRVMSITSRYKDLSINEKIDALEELNFINYQKLRSIDRYKRK